MNNSLLTLNFTAYCGLAEAFETRFDGPVRLGAEPLTLVLITRGQCALLEEDRPDLLEAGHLVGAAGPVRLEPVDEAEAAGVVLTGLIATEAAGITTAPIVLDIGNSWELSALLTQLTTADSTTSALETSLTAYKLLARLTEARPPAAGRSSALIAAAVREIHRRYAEVYGVAELAEHLGVSKHHLIRAFTAAVGRSPGRYLTLVRLEAVKRALVRFSYPLEVVAGMCGFAGANYLVKVFKKETGLTPAVWRARWKSRAAEDIQLLTEREDRMFL